MAGSPSASDAQGPGALPILRWLPAYDRRGLAADVAAAVTVWALVVPEAMAYAGIAGVPVQYGLYSVPLALVAYAVLGGCQQLVMGPSATIATLSAAGVGAVALAGTSPTAYVALTAVMALLVGVLYVLGGLLRMGFIANFFAKPVLDGFIIGLGLFIAVGQIPKLVGIHKPSGNTLQVLWRTLTDIGEWNWPTVAVGATAIVALFALHHFLPKVPAAIVVVIASILLVDLLDLKSAGVETVGTVPTGFTFVSYSGITWSDVAELVPGALAILVVGFAQSIAIAKSFAAEHHYAVDASREMVAYGASNIGAGALQGFASTGSLSKSAAAQGARLKSQLALLIAAGLVLLTILFLAGLFQNLPEAVLGAIVIEAVAGMVKPEKLIRLRRARTPEFWAALGAMLGVLLIDILPGVVIGCALSFMLLIHEMDHPRIAELGRTGDGTRFRDLASDPTAQPVEGVLVQRFEAPLVFTNAEMFISTMSLRVASAGPGLRRVVLDLGPVSQVDVTGAQALLQLDRSLQGQGVELVLARASGSVRDALDRLGVLDEIAGDRVVPTVRQAVEAPAR